MSISRTVGMAVLAGCLVLSAGCAGRKGGRTSGEPLDSGGGRPRVPQREGILLPGQDRLLPSQDPRNQPQGDSIKVSRLVRPAYEPPPELPDDNPFPPPPVPSGAWRYRVQVLATTYLEKAVRLREELIAVLGKQVYLDAERGIWKVQVGDEADRSAAQTLRRRLIGLGYEDAFIVESKGR
jgi:hypothetical protein